MPENSVTDTSDGDVPPAGKLDSLALLPAAVEERGLQAFQTSASQKWVATVVHALLHPATDLSICVHP